MSTALVFGTRLHGTCMSTALVFGTRLHDACMSTGLAFGTRLHDACMSFAPVLRIRRQSECMSTPFVSTPRLRLRDSLLRRVQPERPRFSGLGCTACAVGGPRPFRSQEFAYSSCGAPFSSLGLLCCMTAHDAWVFYTSIHRGFRCSPFPLACFF
ncbi:hypothetical protein B0H12DRAFT_1103883 [Mycena haematopus]|nr:hypothetical protein B0H12DRAFT_1103883 [Mycena haematopus]